MKANPKIQKKKRKSRLNRYQVLALICNITLQTEDVDIPKAIEYLNQWKDYVGMSEQEKTEIEFVQLALDNQKNFKAWLAKYVKPDKQ